MRVTFEQPTTSRSEGFQVVEREPIGDSGIPQSPKAQLGTLVEHIQNNRLADAQSLIPTLFHDKGGYQTRKELVADLRGMNHPVATLMADRIDAERGGMLYRAFSLTSQARKRLKVAFRVFKPFSKASMKAPLMCENPWRII